MKLIEKCGGALLLALISVNAFAESAGTVYLMKSGTRVDYSNAISNDEGQVVSYTDNYYYINEVGNLKFQDGAKAYGIYHKRSYNGIYLGGDLEIGEGGLSFGLGAYGRVWFQHENGDTPEKGVKVTADQTWNCPGYTGAAGVALFGVGTHDYELGGTNYTNRSCGLEPYTVVPLFIGDDVTLSVDSIKFYLASPLSSSPNGTFKLTTDSTLFPLTYDGTNAVLGAKKLVLDHSRLSLGSELADLWTSASPYKMYSHVVLDSATIASEVVMKDGATIYAENGYYKHCNPEDTTSKRYTTGYDDLDVGVEKISVIGTGNVISCNEINFTRPVTIDLAEGAVLKISNRGSYPMGLKNVTLTGSGTLGFANFNGTVAMFGDVSNFTGTIDVYSWGVSTIVLPADYKETITVTNSAGVTSSRCTSVIYTDADNVITDTAWANAELHIASGETYYVAGNGLTAATTVYLDGGTLITLKDGATIASPIHQTATSNLKTSPYTDISVNLAGWLDADENDKTEVKLNLDGNFVITKGGSFPGNKNTFYLNSGTLKITGEETVLSITGQGGISGSSTATYWGVLDGATLNLPYKASNWNTFWVSGKSSPVFEIGEGATVDVGQSRELHGARNSGGEDNVCTILVNGGTLNFGNAGAVVLGEYAPSLGGKTVLDFRSGLIDTQRAFLTNPYAVTNSVGEYTTTYDEGAPRMEFKWTGGTLKIEGNPSTICGYLLQPKDFYQRSSSQVTSASRTVKNWAIPLNNYNMHVSIEGPDCVLDLSKFPSGSVLTNMPVRTPSEWVGMIDGYEVHDVGGMDWNGTADGCLTVTGGTFAVNYFNANGMKVKLQEAKLVVPAVTNDLNFGEIILDSANAKVVADSVEDGKSVSASLRITENGTWDAGEIDVDGITYKDATFEDGATWKIAADETLELSGVLTLPKDKEALKYQVTRRGEQMAVATFDSIKGWPTWEAIARQCTFKLSESGKALYALSRGFIIIFR